MHNKRWKIPIVWRSNIFINAKSLTRAKEIALSSKAEFLNSSLPNISCTNDIIYRIDETELAKSYPKETINESTDKR